MSVISRFFGVAAVATSALLGSVINIPGASADPCPDVEVVFARGTFEPPGVGDTGQAFVDALRGSSAASRSTCIRSIIRRRWISRRPLTV